MSNVREISDAITERITQARAQIASLEAARSALVQSDAPGPPATRRTPRTRRTRRAPVTPTAVKPPAPAPAPASAPAPKSPARTRRSGDLVAGQLEDLLQASEDGLSLVTLAARADVSDAKVRGRLHELERQGHVRNSGSRRTSLWRLVSDEERIAARAAELERASSTRAGVTA